MKKYVSPFNNDFAEIEDLGSVSDYINLNGKYKNGGVMLWSDTNKAYIDSGDAHTFIAGQTSCGKTSSVILETLIATANAQNPESQIVNDPKGTIYQETHQYLKKKGFKVYLLNYREPGTGNRFNPFEIPCKLYRDGEYDKCNMYLRDIAKQVYAELSSNTNDSYWTNASEDYFVGLAQLVMNITDGKMLTMEILMMLHQYISASQTNVDFVKSFMRTLPSNSEIIPNINGTIENANDTRKCIYGVFSQPLALYNQEAIKDMMSMSDFDIINFAKEPSILYIITPDERTIYNSIVSMFIKQSYSTLVDYAATSEECKNSALPVRVNYLLDEFSNLPRISDMDAMISASRSRNIRFTLAVQSIAQLRKNYGSETADNIINNCANWIVMRSNDRELHRIVEELLGNITRPYSQISKPMIQGNTIRSFKKGQALLVISGLSPLVVQYPHIDEYKFKLVREYTNDFVTREKTQRTLFNFEKFFKDFKKQELFELMSKSSKEENNSSKNENARDSFDVDSLVRKIDERIAKIPDIETNGSYEQELAPNELLIKGAPDLEFPQQFKHTINVTAIPTMSMDEFFDKLPIKLTYQTEKRANEVFEELMDDALLEIEYGGE